MKKLYKKVAILFLILTHAYGHGGHTHMDMKAFDTIKTTLAKHDICKKEYFDIFAYSTRLSYALKGDCAVTLSIYTGKNSFFQRSGKDLETVTLLALEEFEERKEYRGLPQMLEKYKHSMHKEDEEGFVSCGASELFAIRGIENSIGSRLENVKDILNQDASLDCFGKHLLSDCKAAKLTLLFAYGKHKMDFRIKKVKNKCTLIYNNPLAKPPKGTIEDIYAFVNTRYIKEHTSIGSNHFEKTYGKKEENRGTLAYFYVWMQTWFYYMSGL